MRRLSRFISVSLLCVVPALGQSGDGLRIISSTVDGGGGESGGDQFRLIGTIGQPDAGQIEGGIFKLNGGFWVCQTASPPQLATLSTSGGSVPYKTNRYLPIRLGDPGRAVDLQVTAVQLPEPFHSTVFEGQQWWIGQPFRVCEKSDEPGGASCSAVPGQPKGRSFNWYAPLVCDQALAASIMIGTCQNGTCSGGFADGDPCGRDQDCQVLYLEHEGIVPSLSSRAAIYEVRAIDSTCAKDSPGGFSAPLTITQNRLGDFAGLGSQCETPVGGNGPGGEDITAILKKFSNGVCQVKKARCDITRIGGGPPDHRCDSVDITAVLAGFANPATLPWGPVNPSDACRFDAAATSTEGIAAGVLERVGPMAGTKPLRARRGE